MIQPTMIYNYDLVFESFMLLLIRSLGGHLFGIAYVKVDFFPRCEIGYLLGQNSTVQKVSFVMAILNSLY